MGDVGASCEGPPREVGAVELSFVQTCWGIFPTSKEQQSGADATVSGWIWPLVIAETRSAVKENAGV